MAILVPMARQPALEVASMDLNEALHHVGGFGVYQRLVGWLLLLPGTLPSALYTLLVMLQVTYRGQHWCRVPELQQSTLNQTVVKRYR